MSKKIISSLTLLACLLVTAFSQCPTFYADYGLKGTSFQQCSSGDVAASLSDQVSSFFVPTGYSVILHADSGMSGEYWGPYASGSYNVPASFNDRLSSVSIFQKYDSNPKCPTFYADYGLQGASFQLCNSGNVPSEWNDRISSFVLPAGFSIQLYSDANKKGDTRGPYTEGPRNVPAQFNDRISYIAVTNYRDSDSSDSDDAKCAVFYVNANQRGANFQLCSSGNVPTQFNDQVSSFTVPAGVYIQLYADGNYNGEYWGPYTEGKYDMPDGINDKLSSVLITKTTKPNSNFNSNSGSSGNNNSQTNYTCPAFFTSRNQKGDAFQLCSSGNVPAKYNDAAYSIFVPQGYQVRLYQSANYTGRAVGPYSAGTYNLPNNFVARLSSVMVTPLVPTFYADYNLQGAEFQLSTSGNVPSAFNDQVSSFVVPAGYSMTLYGDYNYGGASYGPYSAGRYNVPSQFNDQLSSVVIKKTN